MATAIDGRIREVHHRLTRLERNAQQGTAGGRSRLQRYLDGVRQGEEAACAALYERAAAVDESLEDLDNELDLATHRVAAEFATTVEQLRIAVDAELRRWDIMLDRMQAKAAERTPLARDRIEALISDLRQRRLAIGGDLPDAGAAESNTLYDAKARVLPKLDELKRRADAARTAGDEQ